MTLLLFFFSFFFSFRFSYLDYQLIGFRQHSLCLPILILYESLIALECVFSVGGDIVTKKRNRLGASNTRRLLCLQDWEVLAEGKDEGDSDIEIDLDEEDCRE